MNRDHARSFFIRSQKKVPRAFEEAAESARRSDAFDQWDWPTELLEADVASWDVHGVDSAYSKCIEGLHGLGELGSGAGPVGVSASRRLNRLALLATELATEAASQGLARKKLSPQHRAWPGYQLCHRLPPSVVADLERRRWVWRAVVVSSVVTVVSTLMTVWAMVVGQFVVGLGAVGARIVLNGWLSVPVFPLDYRKSGPKAAPTSFRSIYFACLLAHVCDVTILAGIALAFVQDGMSYLAVLALIAAIIATLGSFFRAAALKVGVIIPRQVYAERAMRVGSLALGLIVAAIAGKVGLLVAVAGPTIFGCVEIVRAAWIVSRHGGTEVGIMVRRRTIAQYEEIDYELTMAPEPRLRRKVADIGESGGQSISSNER